MHQQSVAHGQLLGIRARTFLIAILLLVGCSDYGDSESAAPSTSTTAAAPTTTAARSGPTIGWSNVGVIELGSGYSLRDEEGDAPIVAIYSDDEHVGIIEINKFPADTTDLSAHIEQFHSSIEADRKEGCGTDYEYEREASSTLDGPDGEFVRYGFTGARERGAPVTERTIQWAAIQDGELVIINVAAYDEAGCIGTEGAELTVAELEKVEPLLSPVIERSPFPR